MTLEVWRRTRHSVSLFGSVPNLFVYAFVLGLRTLSKRVDNARLKTHILPMHYAGMESLCRCLSCSHLTTSAETDHSEHLLTHLTVQVHNFRSGSSQGFCPCAVGKMKSVPRKSLAALSLSILLVCAPYDEKGFDGLLDEVHATCLVDRVVTP